MERDESGRAQRHGGQSAHRTVILAWGALACGLACLTYQQTAIWSSEEALWTRAHQVAPTVPRPLIGLAWVSLKAGRLEQAEHRLHVARGLAERQPSAERAWALDSIEATQAVIWMRQGKLREAARLMAAGSNPSERWELCQHFNSVCALAASSP